MNDSYVYIIPDSTGVPVYVGKGRGKRHYLSSRRNAKINALISLGGTLPPVIVRAGLSEAEAFELERALIAFHGRADLGLGTLLNLCDGGRGPQNLAAESRVKIRLAKKIGMLGKTHSAETRARMSIAGGKLCGRPWSTARRDAQAAPHVKAAAYNIAAE